MSEKTGSVKIITTLWEGIQMKGLEIYRRRIIPEECLLLKGDEIVTQNEDMIITKWIMI